MTLPYYSNEEIKNKKDEISTNLGNANYFTRIGKVQELIKKEDKDIKILELGCGRGRLSRDLMNEGYKNMTLVDIDNYTDGLEVELKDLSFEKLSFDDNQFDIVLAIAIIEHLENPFLLYREVHRILKPGGKFIVAVPNVLSLKSRINFLLSGNMTGFNRHNNHISFFSKDVFHKVIKNKFNIVDRYFSKGFIKIFGNKLRLDNSTFIKNFGTKELIIFEKI